jgi:tetratricopeptide (TPR) repeat protein
LRETEELLKRLLDRRNGKGAESWLDLGVVLAAQNRFAQSIAALEKAIDQRESAPPDICHEARYHLGRVLTLTAQPTAPSAAPMGYGAPNTGDLDRAVSQLRDATLGDPKNAAAHYYLGLAIRTRVEQEQLVEAERAWKEYLDLGAPQGHKEEVGEFLESRRAFGLGTGPGWATGPSTVGGTGPGTR